MAEALSRSGKARLGRLFVYGCLVVVALLYLMPLWVMVVTSLKPLDEIYGGSFIGMPKVVTLDAWRAAWSEACIGTECTGLKPYFVNSLLMVIPAVALSTGIGAINGYILTKWRFPGANFVFGLCPPPDGVIVAESTRQSYGLSNPAVPYTCLNESRVFQGNLQNVNQNCVCFDPTPVGPPPRYMHQSLNAFELCGGAGALFRDPGPRLAVDAGRLIELEFFEFVVRQPIRLLQLLDLLADLLDVRHQLGLVLLDRAPFTIERLFLLLQQFLQGKLDVVVGL